MAAFKRSTDFAGLFGKGKADHKELEAAMFEVIATND